MDYPIDDREYFGNRSRLLNTLARYAKPKLKSECMLCGAVTKYKPGQRQYNCCSKCRQQLEQSCLESLATNKVDIASKTKTKKVEPK